jgi:hypothetical protein
LLGPQLSRVTSSGRAVLIELLCGQIPRNGGVVKMLPFSSLLSSHY